MASSRIKIFSAKTGDMDLLAGMIRQSHADVAKTFKLTPDNCPRHPSNCTKDWIHTDMVKGVGYFLLFENSIPKGCVAVEKANSHLCYLERLSVLPEFRRKGFGTALVEHAIHTAQTWGTEKIGIGIIAEFEILKQWYKTLGFIEQKTLTIDHLPFKVSLLERALEKQS